MDDAIQKAAYIQAMAACAIIEGMGMMAENQWRMSNGNAPAYGLEAFEALLVKYGVHHNAVVSMFHR